MDYKIRACTIALAWSRYRKNAAGAQACAFSGRCAKQSDALPAPDEVGTIEAHADLLGERHPSSKRSTAGVGCHPWAPNASASSRRGSQNPCFTVILWELEIRANKSQRTCAFGVQPGRPTRPLRIELTTITPYLNGLRWSRIAHRRSYGISIRESFSFCSTRPAYMASYRYSH